MSGAEDGLTAAAGSILEDTLGRLAKKAGVKATLLLDRATGAILKMEGQVAALRTASSSSSSASSRRTGGKDSNGDGVTPANATDGGSSSTADSSAEGGALDGGAATAPTTTTTTTTATAAVDETRGARELAALVWAYVKTSSDLVAAMETEDELKLLRLRTKRQELVIVPDAKYLLIVVHDTPLA